MSQRRAGDVGRNGRQAANFGDRHAIDDMNRAVAKHVQIERIPFADRSFRIACGFDISARDVLAQAVFWNVARLPAFNRQTRTLVAPRGQNLKLTLAPHSRGRP